ncbi:MAG: hypothetical protein EOP48_18735, partial [Sphingobacteriales bacterium]
MEVFLDSDIEQILQIEEPVRASSMPFWSAEAYGFGKHIRNYGYYPMNLPLHIFTDHSGPALRNKFTTYEINNTADVVMFHAPHFVAKWREEHKTKCYPLFSPFVFYRRSHNIQKLKNAKGTIVYPIHTMPELEDDLNFELYIQKLKSLPKQYQPVSVSLHYHDLNKGRHKMFLEAGLRVFTAGNPYDYKFTERFYSILQRFKYASSNCIGTALLYAVEMGVPFFLLGDRPVFARNKDSELAHEALRFANLKDDVLQTFTEAFKDISSEINPQQKSMVEATLG